LNTLILNKQGVMFMKKFSKSALLLTLMGASVAAYAIDNLGPYKWHSFNNYLVNFTANGILDAHKQINDYNAKYCEPGLYDGKPDAKMNSSFCLSAPIMISAKKFQYRRWDWASY
jgi:hypothetical protein